MERGSLLCIVNIKLENNLLPIKPSTLNVHNGDERERERDDEVLLMLS